MSGVDRFGIHCPQDVVLADDGVLYINLSILFNEAINSLYYEKNRKSDT